MPPVYVNSNGNTATIGTNVTVNVPSGVANGHGLIANIGFTGGSGVTVTPPAGWTLIRRDDNGTTLGNALYARIANSEPASYTWTLSSSQNNSGSMIAYSNVDQANLIGANGGQANASSTNVTAPSITTLYESSVVLYFGGVLSVATYTPPSGYTERLDTNSASFADQVFSTPGATGTATAVATSAGVSLAALIEIRAAPATLNQEGFRWRNDNDSEADATWRQAQDTNDTADAEEVVRLRLLIDATNDPTSGAYKLQYREVGDPTWKDVT